MWFCIKQERERVEAVRKKVADMGQEKLTSTQWAKAAGITQQMLEYILCKGRESQERICSSYQRLVISVARSYEGKGLSLKDLIQVPYIISNINYDVRICIEY